MDSRLSSFVISTSNAETRTGPSEPISPPAESPPAARRRFLVLGVVGMSVIGIGFLIQHALGPPLSSLIARASADNLSFADRLDAIFQIGRRAARAEPAVDVLQEIVAKPEEDKFIRVAAVIALGKIGDRRSSECIHAFASELEASKESRYKRRFLPYCHRALQKLDGQNNAVVSPAVQ